MTVTQYDRLTTICLFVGVGAALGFEFLATFKWAFVALGIIATIVALSAHAFYGPRATERRLEQGDVQEISPPERIVSELSESTAELSGTYLRNFIVDICEKPHVLVHGWQYRELSEEFFAEYAKILGEYFRTSESASKRYLLNLTKYSEAAKKASWVMYWTEKSADPLKGRHWMPFYQGPGGDRLHVYWLEKAKEIELENESGEENENEEKIGQQNIVLH